MEAPYVSPMAAARGFPCSCESTVAISCAWPWMAAAHSFSLARRSTSSFFQLLYAAAAAATASSTWARVPRGHVASASPRAGLMTSSCSGVATERPLISMAYELIGSSTCVCGYETREGSSPRSPAWQPAKPRGSHDSTQTVDGAAPDGP